MIHVTLCKASKRKTSWTNSNGSACGLPFAHGFACELEKLMQGTTETLALRVLPISTSKEAVMRPTKVTRSVLIVTAMLMAATPALARGHQSEQKTVVVTTTTKQAPAKHVKAKSAHTKQVQVKHVQTKHVQTKHVPAKQSNNNVAETAAIIGAIGLLVHALK
jgi:hypothetical protein